MQFLVGLGAALVGGILAQSFGMVFGALIGFGGFMLWQQVKELRRQVDRLSADADTGSAEDRPAAQAPVTTPAPRDLQQAASTQAPEETAARVPSVGERTTPSPVATDSSSGAGPIPAAASGSARSAPRPDPARTRATTESDFAKKARELGMRVVRFFTTGNPVVRIGAVILFFGVAFLLRYAYEHSLVPVELRLAGACLGGIALTVIGWRLRHRSDTYGLILQGAGIGILYLTIFASARIWELVPLTAALVLLVVLVIGSCVLAVLQKSQALAVFAMSGGFLAPVLMSTGTGSHVALFSYYALLNAGILGMAWFQFWRWLNWIGFIFTFAIGATWGYQYYEPEHFATTEPFLLLFFFYYLCVSILFARRKEVNLRGLVDGTLVFGTPIIAFALQAALVSDMEFGLAFSALGAAATYTALAVWLKRLGAFSSLLGQSFVALGVVFATLAIPFAFDNQQFTAASWAVEGAGLVWVGIRQKQLLPRAFGLVLQFGAALAYASEFSFATPSTLFLNSGYLGGVLLSLAGLFTAFFISKHATSLLKFESWLKWPLLGWGVFWWFATGVVEIAHFNPDATGEYTSSNVHENLIVLFSAASLALLTFVAGRTRFSEGLLAGFLLLPVCVASLLMQDLGWAQATVFIDLGWIGWPLAVAVLVYQLRQVEIYPRLAELWHAGTWWFLTFLLAWNAVALAHDSLPYSVWSYMLWGAIPLMVSALIFRLKDSEKWPIARFPGAYTGWGLAVVMFYLAGWIVASGMQQGDPDPLPYLVIVNPLELTHLGILLLGYVWIRDLKDSPLAEGQILARIGLAATAFLWLNLTTARAVHFYAGVSYPVEHLIDSDAFRTAASILWTIGALVLMGLGTRRAHRVSWLVGAGLLGLVILKLFIVDLNQLDLVARIVSFISVGVLMLVIGYFAPVPPKKAAEATA